MALDVRAGDIVIVTAYSWPATANVIELCGARPVFVDIRPDTFNIDTACLGNIMKDLMGSNRTTRRVKAILPVHTFGQMADMVAILELADHYKIPVVEDAACALGAALQGHQAGTWGTIGCFSFHPRKAITTGEGGIIITGDEVLAHRLRALRNHGQNPEASSAEFIMPGFNYRMTEFQAALGITQMAKLDRIITARCRLAKRYDELLQNTSIQIPAVLLNNQAVYQSYVVLLPEKMMFQRHKLISHLREQGVETTIGTWHIPMTDYFRNRYGYKKGDFPITDQVFDRALTLPLHEFLSGEDQEKVVELLKKEISCKASLI